MLRKGVIKIIEYFNEECIMGMKRYQDKYFDLAICDPPYFKGASKINFYGNSISKTGVKRRRCGSNNWDIPNDIYFNELLRITKNQIIWGCNYYDINLGPGRIIWDKKNDTSSFSKCEIAYCSMHKGVQIFRYLWNGMIQEDMRNKEPRIHPTQKPIALYKWILAKYAKEGDLILDTHVGSASSLIACYTMGFDAVGFEIDERYFKASKTRLNMTIAQGHLF